MSQPQMPIEGVIQDFSPHTYAALAATKVEFDALAAKDQYELQEVFDLYKRSLIRLAQAVAQVEIEVGVAQGRITRS